MPRRLRARPSALRPLLVPRLRQLALVVGLLLAGGALAGVVWEWIWTPPTGVVVDGRWLLDPEGLRGDASGTVLYVLVAAVTGLVLGVLVGVLFDREEIVSLVGVVVGSVLAGWLMWWVGQSLGPADPHALATTTADRTRLPGELDVAGRSPFVAFPSGALVGLLTVFIGLTRHPGNDT